MDRLLKNLGIRVLDFLDTPFGQALKGQRVIQPAPV